MRLERGEGMNKITTNAAILILISSVLAACAATEPARISVGGSQATAVPTAAPLKETVVPKPAIEATASPAPEATAAVTPQTSPSPKSTPLPVPHMEQADKPQQTGDGTPLSWYYMKKKKGQVPDFPKETKSFTAGQKAVWVGTGKKVYLTIDAGGPLIDVDLMLKSLKDNDVKASFFIAGYNIKKHPEYVKRLVNDGHFIANHTMSHKDFNELTDDQIRREITDFENMYKEITGKEVEKYFRFPYGRYNMRNLSLVSSMGYTSIFWSTAMRDWEPRKNGADDPYNDIMNNLHEGNIILMHQGSRENMEALDRICKEVKKAGYEFALVNELHP